MKSRNIIDSFNYAVAGIIYALKTQRNLRIHFSIATVVLFTSLFLDFSRLEFLMLLLTIAFVMVSEMINTSIEKTIDMITEEYHPLAKIAKNVAAGAVLISAINAIVVGYLLFFDRINLHSNLILFKLKNSPVHLTFVSLLLVIIITVVIKTIAQSGTPFKGGIVSGHAAVAFLLATSISFLGENVLITTLAYFIAILVGESRIEGKIHSVFEVFMGSILGVLMGILVFQIIG
ncbi:phosphatase PAP2 family protein [Anaerosalibacter bizertensis]|uniref:Diacylglycerol kinase n=1 Tax=Anaerosalibacter bizertensis TaxID=932217 RepID=A0A844FI72_9FIRM|nr:diacylglycerol kinase [Anaerosalibacter bizertensis]MBV1817857.1 diacylglycerol kinase [Bacteroidales bacterium MSK.15.36]HHV26259.1 phosphatase PAP2 family protein [Tissierellia bacterium]MBU5294003.1 diacylglycerol kinase [Anaerosalibacter bizertensis]MCB5559278.1 diacylglycerol kinase [Anaerosalibacter bizertensis]MCG4565050.1 diacylglycerol kinase [Anaerosalibacter bizertensis]